MAGLDSYIPQSMVSLSSAAHQPSSERAMMRPSHRSSTVKWDGTSSSLMIITSSLQQQALQDAQVMTAPFSPSGAMNFVSVIEDSAYHDTCAKRSTWSAEPDQPRT